MSLCWVKIGVEIQFFFSLDRLQKIIHSILIELPLKDGFCKCG